MYFFSLGVKRFNNESFFSSVRVVRGYKQSGGRDDGARERFTVLAASSEILSASVDCATTPSRCHSIISSQSQEK